MPSYLVTGGCGFIGSHIVHRLVRDGQAVRVLDNLSTGKRQNIDDAVDRVDLVEGDICDRETVKTAMRDIEYVIHQAALPSVPRSVEDPITSDWNNVRGTLEILVAAKEAKVKRVVQASSSSVYGDTPTLPKIETMTPTPLSPYAVSKLAGELYGRAFHHNYGLEYVGLRYFNVFGPAQDPNSQYAAVLPKFITAYIAKRAPTVFGDGSQSRDFCYIDNVVEANLLACTATNAAGKAFNIGCGDQIDLIGVLKQLDDIFGYHIDAEFMPPRAGDVKHSRASIDQAKEYLGYSPAVRFADGLRRTVEWFSQSRR